MQLAISKRDYGRLAQLQGTTGETVRPEVLAVADEVRGRFPALAEFVSDEMVLLWAKSGFLARKDSAQVEEADLQFLIAWYYVANPTETAGGGIYSTLAEAGLHLLAQRPVLDSVIPGLPYTALMAALHQFRPDLRRSYDIPGNGLGNDVLRWYYLHGVGEHRLQRCITAREVVALNTSVTVNEMALLSVLDLWALDRIGALAQSNLTTAAGQIRARELAWTARETDPVFVPYEPVGPRARARAPGTVMTARVVPALLSRAAAGEVAAGCRVRPGHAEYFGRDLPGCRLLVHGEWFDAKSNHIWARFPIASMLFFLEQEDAKIGRVCQLGFAVHPYPGANTLGQSVQVVLNGAVLAMVEVARAIQEEVVLRHGVLANLRMGGLNLLQFITSAPLVSAEHHLGEDDRRTSGIALRRIWVT